MVTILKIELVFVEITYLTTLGVILGVKSQLKIVPYSPERPKKALFAPETQYHRISVFFLIHPKVVTNCPLSVVHGRYLYKTLVSPPGGLSGLKITQNEPT